MKVKQWLQGKAMYDRDGQNIFMSRHKQGGYQILVDVRGWGAIQNLFMNDKGEVDFEKASEFQDELGHWIADAINEKLNKD